ncbi:L30e-like protein [Syncephalis plumigaleata]|nr:L30e-like protein [Syncephalis plumigaleata]
MSPQKGSKKVGKVAGKGKKVAKNTVHPHVEKRSRNFGIGQDIQPQRDLTRFVRWPAYVRLQRQRKILKMRLKVPPTINQFTKVLDRNTATQLFKLVNKYRPETRKEKKERLFAAAAAKADGKAEKETKKPYVVKFGINHITALVESKKAQLVVIADDVDPIELVLWLPASAGKARLGTVVHNKTATALAITDVRDEDKAALASLVTAVNANYIEKFEDHRRTWGGGIMGMKTQATLRKREKAAAREAAKSRIVA